MARKNDGNANAVYEFDAKAAVNGFGIYSAAYAYETRSPRCFKLEGAN